MAAKDVLETENSNSTCASQCIETSILPAEVQKAEGKRYVHVYLFALFRLMFTGCVQNDIAYIRQIEHELHDF